MTPSQLWGWGTHCCSVSQAGFGFKLFLVLACHLPALDGFIWHFQGWVHCNLSSAINISQKVFREHQETNLGMLGEKQGCYLCAMQPLPPISWLFGGWAGLIVRAIESCSYLAMVSGLKTAKKIVTQFNNLYSQFDSDSIEGCQRVLRWATFIFGSSLRLNIAISS